MPEGNILAPDENFKRYVNVDDFQKDKHSDHLKAENAHNNKTLRLYIKSARNTKRPIA